MKKNDWIYLANAMWEYSEKHEGRVSQLLKQLIKEVNKNKEVMIDDNETISKTTGSERVYDSNSSGNIPFKGNGEF
jgi:hypothetical protein|tara:strand:- start:649 stop:876 length:228 start_codon:yes stop_codon:yes gene_type:complete